MSTDYAVRSDWPPKRDISTFNVLHKVNACTEDSALESATKRLKEARVITVSEHSEQPQNPARFVVRPPARAARLPPSFLDPVTSPGVFRASALGTKLLRELYTKVPWTLEGWLSGLRYRIAVPVGGALSDSSSDYRPVGSNPTPSVGSWHFGI